MLTLKGGGVIEFPLVQLHSLNKSGECNPTLQAPDGLNKLSFIIESQTPHALGIFVPIKIPFDLESIDRSGVFFPDRNQWFR